MTTNKDPGYVAKKMIELVDRQDWVGTMELVAPTARAWVGSMQFDREGWMAMGQMFYAAFPDARHEIISVHVAGEHATVVATFRGTHRGDFMGVPATNKSISFEVIHVDRVVDGRVVEHRGQFDSAGLMQQIAPPSLDRAYVDDLFRRIDSQSYAAVAEVMAPTAQFRMGSQTFDRVGYESVQKLFFGAFPDGRHVHDEVIIAGDRAIVIGHFVGTHRAAFQGIPATGRPIKLSYIGVGRVAAGKLVEMRVEIDSAGLVQQLTA